MPTNKTPAKQDPQHLPSVRVTTQAGMDQLRAKLAQSPPRAKINKYAQNSLYIPISYVEAELDNQFGPLNWQVDNLNLQQIGGEVKEDKSFAYFSCSLTLRVLNPVTGYWIARDGVASGQTTGKQITTFAGKLKAEAVKNAAKSLGPIFGRDLNRDEVYEDRTSAGDLRELQRQAEDDFAEAQSTDEVLSIQQAHPDRRQTWFRAIAAKRWQELNAEEQERANAVETDETETDV